MEGNPVVIKSQENHCFLRLMILKLWTEYCESPLNHQGSGPNTLLVLMDSRI